MVKDLSKKFHPELIGFLMLSSILEKMNYKHLQKVQFVSFW